MKIRGAWREGYVLDYHTVSSQCIGYDGNGNPIFDTRRTEIGELLYKLKYNRNKAALAPLVEVAAQFISKWSPTIEVVVPVPPTRARTTQPVIELAIGIANALGSRVPEDFVRNTSNSKELKNVFDYKERLKLLAGAYNVQNDSLRGKSILLFDDLYRSGATLNAVTAVLYKNGGCSSVYALALTRTRTVS